jgi:hypothetical protein
MAQMPTPEELSARLRMPGSRPAARKASPEARGAPQMAEDGARRGPSSAGVSDAAAKAEQRRRVSEAMNANALIHARLIGTRERYANDADFATVQQRWEDDDDRILEDGLGRISHDGLRDHVARNLAPALAYERAAMQDKASRGAAQSHAVNRDAMLLNLVQRRGLDPNDMLLGGGIDAYHMMIDDAAARGYLSADDALAEKRRGALALCEGTYVAMARRDPGRAIRELQGAVDGHPLLVHLPQERKDALIGAARQRQAANAIDAGLAAQRQEEQAKRTSDDAEAAIVNDLVGDQPSTTANTVLDNAALSADARQRLLGAVEHRRHPEPITRTSNATALGLLDRIRRVSDEPQRIASLARLVIAYNEGRLSRSDLQYVTRQLAEAGTPEGQSLARDRRDFTNLCKPLIVPAGLIGRRDDKREDAAP